MKTAQFSKLYQAEYAKWCATEFKHSPAYVSRTLSVIAAACRYGSKTMLVKDEGGQLKEARLLRFMPEICYDAKWLAEVMQAPEPGPKDYVPTFDDLAGLLDCDGSQLLQRYDIIALNTWARPEAIVELNVKAQVDFEHGLLHLNPPNRRQNKKHRPTIRLTNNLRGWLEYWGENQPLSYSRLLHNGTKHRFASSHIKAQFTRQSTRWMLTQAGYSKAEIDEFLYCARRSKLQPIREALAKAERKGTQRVTRYTLRHFMATRVRGLTDLRVDREQRSLWLGHGRKDTTSWYETLDPEFLRECTLATSRVIDKLNQLTHRTLVPPNIQAMRDLAMSGSDGRMKSTAALPT